MIDRLGVPTGPQNLVSLINYLIVLAGGQGSRFGNERNKVYARVGGRDLLWYPLQAAARFPAPVRVIVVIRPEDRDLATALSSEFDGLGAQLVVGGRTRYESERAGLDVLAEVVAGEELIGVHDGARPFLTIDLWQSCIAVARESGGAIPVLESGSLFRIESNELKPLGLTAHRAQTPQVFRAAGLLGAFRNPSESAPDTAATVMRAGTLEVAAVPGDPRNIKVTYPADLDRAARLAESWRAGRWLFGL